MPFRAPWSGISRYSPAEASTPLAWWVRGDNVVLNGATVSQWTDISSAGRNWAQATPALQATWTASAINGQPGLTFDAAATQYLTGPNISALTGLETFIVFQRNADPPPTSAKAGLWRVSTAAAAAVVPFTDGVIYDDFGSTVRKTTVNPGTSLATPVIYNVISVAGEWSSYLNGALIYGPVANTVGLPGVPAIGGSPSSGNWMDGVICEWIAYTAKLSAGDRANVTAYLKARYGIA